ncbi:aldolase catalytic domain-containing protein [Sphaerochaeta sp.]|uniref:aldolase catalytic domain-containing protein n=1 Tax=Sphaerochaeta sp. TaxID=1972642 RepID=UPI002FCBC45E
MIQLLDCTLRDGGYVNDWNFGHDNLVSVFERVVDAGVDIIEIGFLDERRDFDINRSIMPDSESVNRIYGMLRKKETLVVGMIDFGTCSIERILPCNECFLDGIRVIFKKHLREPALKFCKALKNLGYQVFAQLVSITSYNDEEILDLIRLANETRPDVVSIVDTYGLMHQNNLMHYFHLLNNNLLPDIGLGYHGHNNFQMGYANCIAMLSNKIERKMVVDGSIYGMGKGAGNAPLELVALYMNNSLGKNYHISQMLEAIDANISQFYHAATWGYNMFYYLAASNDCHPNYVAYLMSKRTLSVKSTNEILSKLHGEKKLLYDKNYIEKLYADYQNNEVNDSIAKEKLAKVLRNKNILVMGPGKTVASQGNRIRDYIEQTNPIVISINQVPSGFTPNYIFLSNSKRYVQLATRLSQENHLLIATSNVTGTSEDAFDYVLNYSGLIDLDAEIIDNSLIMFLKTLIQIGCTDVGLAGFDGYSAETSNYYNDTMEYDFVKEKAAYLNTYTRKFLCTMKDKLHVHFITDSKYLEC